MHTSRFHWKNKPFCSLLQTVVKVRISPGFLHNDHPCRGIIFAGIFVIYYSACCLIYLSLSIAFFDLPSVGKNCIIFFNYKLADCFEAVSFLL